MKLIILCSKTELSWQLNLEAQKSILKKQYQYQHLKQHYLALQQWSGGTHPYPTKNSKPKMLALIVYNTKNLIGLRIKMSDFAAKIWAMLKEPYKMASNLRATWWRMHFVPPNTQTKWTFQSILQIFGQNEILPLIKEPI